MSARQNERSSRRWQAFRRRYLAHLTHPTCHLCHQPIDLQLKFPHDDSPTLDHLTPITEGGDMYDQANIRPAHLGCNRRRGSGLPPPATPTPSRHW